MRKFAAILFILVLTLLSTVPAFAENYELDPFTGQIIGRTDSSDPEAPAEVRISNNCTYDKDQKLFTFTTASASNAYVQCSLYDGEITTGTVTLNVGEGARVSMYLDGEKLSAMGQMTLNDSGYYTIRNNDSDKVLLSFTIVPETTCMLAAYKLPSIFFVTGLSRDGKKLSINDTSMVSLAEDGAYSIIYQSTPLNLYRNLYLRIDHTAPVLEIEGVKSGIATGPVTLGETENGSTLTVMRDGERLLVPGNPLKTPGVYHLTYTDNAGNSTFYDFTIRFYMDITLGALIAAVAVLLIAIIVYIIHARRHMRTY